VKSTTAGITTPIQQQQRTFERPANSKPGPAFFIADSDHTKVHVLAELEQLRTVTEAGDYVVIEDGRVNVPYEALEQYTADHPNEYQRDESRERKFDQTLTARVLPLPQSLNRPEQANSTASLAMSRGTCI
jgi:cephalosporin hydroxylase